MERPFDISNELFPFRSNWCEIEGIPVHYVDEGQGPVTLLLHGNFMWSFSYRRLIRALSKSCRCISIDLAGMGMSGKPHALGKNEFHYTYEEQSQLVEKVITTLDLRDITFLSFDHGGPVGFGIMTRNPARFSRIIIANSWAWSCHEYRASKIWSMVSPVSKRCLRKFMLNKKRWLFEDKADMVNPDVWEACINPYPKAGDFRPIAQMARQLTRAKPYFEQLKRDMHRLADKDIEIIWSVKEGGLFPEFIREDMLLNRWREIFPEAPVKLIADTGYYSLVTRPSEALLDTLLH